MRENKAVGRWKVGDSFKSKKQKESKCEFKSGKARQDLSKCRKQGGQQKRDNRVIGQKYYLQTCKTEA